MPYLNWIVLALWLIMLFAGAKVMKRGQWNGEALSFSHTKAILGFCAIGVIIHHCAEKTSAYWLPSYAYTPGLEWFTDMGFLLVALFFFYSGYGLYQSLKTKKNSLQFFFAKRYTPLIFAYFATLPFFILLMKIYKVRGIHPLFWSPHSWYIFAILYFYLVFWLGFRFFKNENTAILICTLGTVAWILICIIMDLGLWWHNTCHLFVIGIVFSKYEKKILSALRKIFFILIPPCVILTAAGLLMSRYIGLIMMLGYMMSSVTFVLLIILISMKVKIGNPVLIFYGKMTLELYLAHGIFSELFSRNVIAEYAISKCHIKNIALYLVTVIVCGTLAAYPLSIINQRIKKSLLNRLTRDHR